MIKHKYNVYGVSCVGGSLFNGSCVADDIIKAIELFREKQCSVWNIERKEQVSADTEIGIKSLNILGGYSAEGKSRTNIYGLYKRIMKRDPKVIDEIESLDEAKEVISMMMGNQYLNGIGIRIDEKFMEEFKQYIDSNPQIFTDSFIGKDKDVILRKYNDDIMKAVRQNMGLVEDDESSDEEIMQMDEKEIFKAYCHWNGFLGNWYSTLIKTVEDIFGVELE